MADFSQLLRGLDQIEARTPDVMPIVASTALQIMKERIYGQGQDAGESKIGTYSSSPTLIGRTSFTTAGAANKVFGSASKRRALKWVTLNGRRLAVLPGGYKAIRELEGRQTSFVDLRRTGTMENSHTFQVLRNGFEIGFDNVVQGEKMAFNEARFKTIISHFSDNELDQITDVYVAELARIAGF